MNRDAAALLAELDQEQAKTRALLERIPEDRLDWRPHERSMTLGQLGLHVATIPGTIASFLAEGELDVDNITMQQPAGSRQEMLDTLETSDARAHEVLGAYDDAAAHAIWKLVKGDVELVAVPRVVMARSFLLNHLVHHRGQLTVYLRLLDVPVPSTYGPTADDNPFA